MRCGRALLMLGCLAWIGCGTTRWSDTARTATEQMLVSDAIDREVSQMDFRALAGKRVYFDITYLRTTIDADYIASSLRQHALANGCVVKTRAEDADYIAEIRAGAVGTDRHDMLFGIPATSLPTGTGMNAVVPELPLVKKTDQRAVAKIALFAYNRRTGRPVWQSGLSPTESKAKDIWVFGAGPFQKGNIHQGMNFAGEKLPIAVITPGSTDEAGHMAQVSVASEAFFNEPNEPVEVAQRPDAPATSAPSTSVPAGPGTPASSNSSILPPAIPSMPMPASPNIPAGSNMMAPVQSQGTFFNVPAATTTPAATGVSPNAQLPQFQLTPLTQRLEAWR